MHSVHTQMNTLYYFQHFRCVRPSPSISESPKEELWLILWLHKGLHSPQCSGSNNTTRHAYTDTSAGIRCGPLGTYSIHGTTVYAVGVQQIHSSVNTHKVKCFSPPEVSSLLEAAFWERCAFFFWTQTPLNPTLLPAVQPVYPRLQSTCTLHG